MSKLNSISSHSSTEQVIKDEMEALCGIYSDELYIIKKYKEFGIKIKANSLEADKETTDTFVELIFRYPENYPKSLPTIKIDSSQGISAKALSELEKLIKETAEECASENVEMADRIIVKVKEKLDAVESEKGSLNLKNNVSSLSDFDSEKGWIWGSGKNIKRQEKKVGIK